MSGEPLNGGFWRKVFRGALIILKEFTRNHCTMRMWLCVPVFTPKPSLGYSSWELVRQSMALATWICRRLSTLLSGAGNTHYQMKAKSPYICTWYRLITQTTEELQDMLNTLYPYIRINNENIENIENHYPPWSHDNLGHRKSTYQDHRRKILVWVTLPMFSP